MLNLFSFFFCFLFGFSSFIYLYHINFFFYLGVIPNSKIPNVVTDLNFGPNYHLATHTSFKLNVVTFCPLVSSEPIEGPTVHPDPELHLISQFMQSAEFFSFLANALITIVMSCDLLIVIVVT